MSFHNLSNQEIVFLYLVSKSITEQYEETFTDKSLEQTIPTEFGMVKIEHEIPTDLVDELKKGAHYTNFKSIEEKLKPIYELIKETEPQMVEKISEVFPSTKKE